LIDYVIPVLYQSGGIKAMLYYQYNSIYINTLKYTICIALSI